MRPQFLWQLRSTAIPLGRRTCVMGIVNVTPDSFSDGGQHLSADRAADYALQLLDSGADMVDVGGESTRPGSSAGTHGAISAQEEQDRVLPVLEAILLRRPQAILSIDTYRATTAALAVGMGVEIVNDVSGLQWDPEMAGTVADLHCGLVLMHTRGRPSQWEGQQRLEPGELLSQIQSDLQASLVQAYAAGVSPDRIVLDPGFGFGKRGEENWILLTQLSRLAKLERPLLAGISRKGFLAPATPVAERDPHTHAANALAIANGAHIVRVHDARGARLAADVADRALAAEI